MTTIACWFNREENTRIWICGDGKLSRNKTTLVESAAKIFSIPVCCYAPDSQGLFERCVYSINIAMAYAGSSLVGLNVHAALGACLSRLNTIGNNPPALNEIAEFARKIMETYVSQLSVSAGHGALAELVIGGYCPIEEDFVFFHIKPVLTSNTWYCETLHYGNKDTPDDYVLLIGSDKTRIRESITRIREGKDGFWWWRAPIDVVMKETKESPNDEIGGHMQMGIGNQNGFDLYSILDQSSTGPATMSYLGFNVFHDFHQIGDCVVGMRCMSVFSAPKNSSESV
jgi:hypothetical protein